VWLEHTGRAIIQYGVSIPFGTVIALWQVR
jgi:hypothetical protein